VENVETAPMVSAPGPAFAAMPGTGAAVVVSVGIAIVLDASTRNTRLIPAQRKASGSPKITEVSSLRNLYNSNKSQGLQER
jgi:hypothetical protein